MHTQHDHHHAAAAAADTAFRLAPAGFTPEQREQFDRDGFLVIEDAISPDEVQRYIDAIDRKAAADPTFKPDAYFAPQNIVERDRVFAELIDHERHLGFVYEFYGELTKRQQSLFLLRPKGGWHNPGTPTGPAACPTTSSAPTCPSN